MEKVIHVQPTLGSLLLTVRNKYKYVNQHFSLSPLCCSRSIHIFGASDFSIYSYCCQKTLHRAKNVQHGHQKRRGFASTKKKLCYRYLNLNTDTIRTNKRVWFDENTSSSSLNQRPPTRLPKQRNTTWRSAAFISFQVIFPLRQTCQSCSSDTQKHKNEKSDLKKCFA